MRPVSILLESSRDLHHSARRGYSLVWRPANTQPGSSSLQILLTNVVASVSAPRLGVEVNDGHDINND